MQAPSRWGVLQALNELLTYDYFIIVGFGEWQHQPKLENICEPRIRPKPKEENRTGKEAGDPQEQGKMGSQRLLILKKVCSGDHTRQ